MNRWLRTPFGITVSTPDKERWADLRAKSRVEHDLMREQCLADGSVLGPTVYAEWLDDSGLTGEWCSEMFPKSPTAREARR